MSKLEDLIKEYCPDGVEYKKLKDVSIMQRGISITKAQANYGYYPVVSGGRDPSFYCDRFNREGETITVAGSGAGAGFVQYWNSPIFANDCFTLKGKTQLNTKFLYYFLTTLQDKIYSLKKGGGVPHVHISDIEDFSLPVPPLPVQEEIVRILDSFTQLTAELTAELTARKKQYEHYRETLMRFTDVPYISISELLPNIRNGFVGTVTSFFTDKENGIRYLEGTNIHNGVISDNEVLYVTKDFHKKHIKNELKSDDILMVQSGHIGDCAVVGGKYKGSNCHALIIMSNGGLCNSKFYVHYFHTVEGMKHLKPAITDGNLKHVLAGKMSFVKVPFPPIDQQNKIVKLLDKFEAFCNDISSGLPAEIEARQKQYEYYRDSIFIFKEI